MWLAGLWVILFNVLIPLKQYRSGSPRIETGRISTAVRSAEAMWDLT